MLPAAVLSGWMGLAPDGKQLFISPKLPEGIDSLGVKNLRVLGSLCQVTVSGKKVEITAAEGSSVPPVVLPPGWKITKSADKKSLTGILP
jgi:trehalose/maltose hydrolase-like predicted phosphorylase